MKLSRRYLRKLIMETIEQQIFSHGYEPKELPYVDSYKSESGDPDDDEDDIQELQDIIDDMSRRQQGETLISHEDPH